MFKIYYERRCKSWIFHFNDTFIFKVDKHIPLFFVFKIFIIEDDLTIRFELSSLLTKYGYTCEWSDDYSNMVSSALNSNPHLILLDVTLPQYDGYHICREIRKISDIPIIIVTSRNSDFDELMSMNLGADDFITKPYNTQVLLARISSVLRRTNKIVVSNTIELSGVLLDINKSKITYEKNSCELTKNELRIINLLMNNCGKIISREEIINELWQSDEFIDDNTLTVNINRLRKKLEEIGVVDFLITKRGQGYFIAE